MTGTYTTSCEYCGEKFVAYLHISAQQMKANHKATCPQKRYLGGELTIVTSPTNPKED